MRRDGFILYVMSGLLFVISAAEAASKPSVSDEFVETFKSGDAADVIDFVVKRAGEAIHRRVDSFSANMIEKGFDMVRQNAEAKKYVKTGFDILNAVEDVLKESETVEEGTDDCVFRCPIGPAGARRPFKNIHHRPSSDGCGSYGLKFDPRDFPFASGCCHAHDKCYDECGNDKENCDERFGVCLKNGCRGMLGDETNPKPSSDCDLMAEGLYRAVRHLGCQAYLDAQKVACICV